MLIRDRSDDFRIINLKTFSLAGKEIKLSSKQQKMLLDTLDCPDIKFYLFPTKTLINKIVDSNDETFSQLPKPIVKAFIGSDGVLFDQSMIVKKVKGNLDERNSLLFDYCDIKYAGILPEELRNCA